jgi:hypothetical protein
VYKKFHTAGAALRTELAVPLVVREGKVPAKRDSFCTGTRDAEKSAVSGSRVVERALKVSFAKV